MGKQEKEYAEADQKQKEQRYFEKPEDLSEEEQAKLRAEFGDDWKERWQEAVRNSVFNIKDFLLKEGAEILLELIGFKDLERCFLQGDIASCVFTVLNFVPVGKIVKALQATKLVTNIVAKIPKILDLMNSGKNFLSRLRNVASKITSGCSKIGGCRLPGACFIAGTRIKTEQGDRPIEEIKVGDRVWSRNISTGAEELKPVLQTFIKTTDELKIITIKGKIITTTPEHPFWVQGKGWVEAQNLSRGSPLSQQNYATTRIENIRTAQVTTLVYNFEVEETHTYFASTGTQSLLVHNNGLACGVAKQVEKKSTELSKHAAELRIQEHAFGSHNLAVTKVKYPDGRVDFIHAYSSGVKSNAMHERRRS